MAKFKYGDKVITHAGHAGKIVSVTKRTTGYWCTVKFDNDKLIPSEYDYPEYYVEFSSPNQEECPICSTKWTITKFNSKEWKDCKVCKRTSEELIETFNNTKELEKKLNIDFEDKDTNGNKIDTDDDDDGWFCF